MRFLRCLVEQTKRAVCGDLRRSGLHELAIQLIGLGRFVARPSDEAGFLGILVPDGMVPDAEIVAVVGEEFFEASPGDVGMMRVKRKVMA